VVGRRKGAGFISRTLSTNLLLSGLLILSASPPSALCEKTSRVGFASCSDDYCEYEMEGSSSDRFPPPGKTALRLLSCGGDGVGRRSPPVVYASISGRDVVLGTICWPSALRQKSMKALTRPVGWVFVRREAGGLRVLAALGVLQGGGNTVDCERLHRVVQVAE